MRPDRLRPAAFGALATLISPSAALLGCAGSVCLGTLVVASVGSGAGARASEDPGASASERSGLGPLVPVCAAMPATLTTGYLFADARAPAARHSEAFALVGLALNAGVAAGSAAAGRLAAHDGAGHGFLLACGGLAACALTAAATSLRPTVSA